MMKKNIKEITLFKKWIKFMKNIAKILLTSILLMTILSGVNMDGKIAYYGYVSMSLIKGKILNFNNIFYCGEIYMSSIMKDIVSRTNY